MSEPRPLRLILADIMDGLGLTVGADALLWAHEFEDGEEALRGRIADLEAEVEALECSENELTEERDNLQNELAKCRKEISETAAAA